MKALVHQGDILKIERIKSPVLVGGGHGTGL